MKEKIESELQTETIKENTLNEAKTEYDLNINNDDNNTKAINTDISQETIKIDISKIEEIKEGTEEQPKEEFKEYDKKVEVEEKHTENIENAHSIIEEINNEEVQKEFQEIKEKMKGLNDNPQVVSEDFNEMYAKMFGKLPISEKDVEDDFSDEQRKAAKDIITTAQETMFEIDEVKKVITPYKIIGVVFKTYIVLEIEKEMYILDQHAAHERIMYEKVKENYYSEGTKDSQMLLLPDVITLTHKEMDITRENMSMFTKAGFTLEEFGDNTIKLTGVPTICFELDTKELFIETLDEINTVARTAKQEKEERFIATVACKAAVKGNMNLDVSEIEILLDKLLKLPNPFTCPHGRPTAIKMTKYDIERKFARK